MGGKEGGGRERKMEEGGIEGILPWRSIGLLSSIATPAVFTHTQRLILKSKIFQQQVTLLTYVMQCRRKY